MQSEDIDTERQSKSTVVFAIIEVVASAFLRLISLVAFYALPFPFVGTPWVSDFYLPASLMIFFIFLGSIWSVVGITLGSLMYIHLYRALPWDLSITTSLPSSFALLITMLFLYTVSNELLFQPLIARLTYARIVMISVVYAFWNSCFYFIAFLLNADYFANYVLFEYKSLLHLFIGDVLGGVLVIGCLKTIVALGGAKFFYRFFRWKRF